MADVISCIPCCTTTPPVNVPGGQGATGNDGADGINAYSTVTGAGFSTPANVGDTVTGMPVDTSAWMVIGQIIVFDGPATFQVTNIPNGTSVDGIYLGYPGDIGTSQAIAAGATVSASGVQPALTTAEATASGTVYDVTATYAAVNFGTNDPVISLAPNATTNAVYLILARAKFTFVAATFAATETGFIKLHRNSPAAADVTGSEASFPIPIIAGATTEVAWDLQTPPLLYTTTAGATNVIQMFAMVSALTNPGEVQITEASIVAIKIS